MRPIRFILLALLLDLLDLLGLLLERRLVRVRGAAVGLVLLDQRLKLGLDRGATAVGLIDLRLVGGLALLTRGLVGRRAEDNALEVGHADAGDHGARLGRGHARKRDGCKRQGRSQRSGLEKSFHQNCVPTLKEKVLGSSPSCFLIVCDTSIRKGPKGEFQFTPTPMATRGSQVSPR